MGWRLRVAARLKGEGLVAGAALGDVDEDGWASGEEVFPGGEGHV